MAMVTLVLLILLFREASCLSWDGSNVCSYSYQSTYTRYYQSSYGCGTWGWSTCYSSKSYTGYRTSYDYECCSGWEQANYWDSGCYKAKCHNYEAGTCDNGGICTAPGQCDCPSWGYFDNSCSDVNECEETSNGGCLHYCHNTVGSFSCSCVSGYGLLADGKTCDYVCYGMDAGECANGGTCVEVDQCSCVGNYVDYDCGDYNECADSNGGCAHNCYNERDSFNCSCDDGYVIGDDGLACEDKDECAEGHSCEQVCVNEPGSYTCTCNTGYSLGGDSRDCNDVDECAVNNGGCSHTCQNTEGSFTCACPDGYDLVEKSCIDIDECLNSDICNGHGECVNSQGSFVCNCYTGYQPSDDTMCGDIDECSAVGDCGQNCANTDGSYTCSCHDGFLLQDDDRTCQDVDECQEANGGCGHTCTNGEGSFSCSCNDGYQLGVDGKICSDIDECAENNGGCDQTCTNSEGSFTCSCGVGYLLNGDGNSCSDEDECSNDPCGQSCENTVGSFVCSCGPGYNLLPDYVSCEDIDECATENGGCDHNCANSDGSFSCSCNPGYQLHDKSCSDIDECSLETDECTQICTNIVASYECSCDTGYYLLPDAKTCEDTDECALDEDGCGQVCNNHVGSFSCSCHHGYRLQPDEKTCQDINECSEHTDGCEQRCENTEGAFSCSCLTGYSLQPDAKSCQDDDECTSDPCEQNCQNTAGSFTCSCDGGYKLLEDALSCSDVDECAQDSGGCSQVCVNSQGSYHCECNTGYILHTDGKACQDIEECEGGTDDCAQNCLNTAGSFTCNCDGGYQTSDLGRTCTDTDECLTSNGGCAHTCIDSEGSFSCQCNAGYSTNDGGFNCNDNDECVENNGGCGQVCTNEPGSFSCSCLTGYRSVDGAATCNDDDECLVNNGDCAHNCHNQAGSYQCSCDTGYQTTDAGKTCTDIDECSEGTSGCEHTCTNDVGSFTCSCFTGYSLQPDEKNCQDVDECLSNNGGCGQQCNNEVGSYSCSCDSGYVLRADQKHCDDIDECVSSNGGCAHECHNTNGDYFCTCSTGYETSDEGVTCTDIDECASNNGGCDHNCLDTDGSFSCSCETGYSLQPDETSCQDIDECSLANGGCAHTCTNSESSYQCSCRDGYRSDDNGVTCLDINECDLSNGGCDQSCHNSAGSFSCSCLYGYSTSDLGVTCTDVNECLSSNGGCAQNCANSPGTFSCSCDTGYTPRDDAKFCDDVDECSVNNGGCSQVCANSVGSFDCSCSPGYTSTDGGVNCFDVEECGADNGGCQHNCHNAVGGFSCSCNTGFSTIDDGLTCTDLDECLSANGGCAQNCENRVGSHLCSCDTGYNARELAKYCDDIDECDTNNGGCSQTCTNSPGSFTCFCISGYDSDDGGKTCYDVEECTSNNGGCAQNCVNSAGSFQCNCNGGYATIDNGFTCTDVDECITENGGCAHTCENFPGYSTCTCYSGFTTPDEGRSCNNIDECASNNGGCSQTCVDSPGTFECLCLAGYASTDNQVSCFDVDECLINNGNCSHNCHNSPGSFHCTCRSGFDSNDNQVTCLDIDECGTNNGGCSQNCHNSPGGFSCSCDEGYDSDDNHITCNDIDECDAENGGCDHTCHNTVPGHYCRCDAGFSTPDNHVSCFDIDECATNNGGCSQTCVNTEGSFHCLCRPGHYSNNNNVDCLDINECESNNGGCSQTCTNTQGAFYCSCLSGYESTDQEVTCIDILECDSNNGGCDHICTNTPGSFSCSCESSGYSTPDQGKSCYDIDECAVDNGGCDHNCQNQPGEFGCTCRNGYVTPDLGFTCNDINECETNNGGCSQNCHNSPGSYSCSCDGGFVTPDGGVSCSDIDECAVRNGGCQQTCVNSQGSYACQCRIGYSPSNNGITCTDIIECNTANGGCNHTCTNSDGSFGCTCRSGYFLLDDGLGCQDTDECAVQNAGCQQVCNNEPGTFSCGCYTGYLLLEDGVSCQDIDECATTNGDCTHNCSNSAGTFACSCNDGYFLETDAKTCSDVDECSVDNGDCGHTCHNTESSYFCTCDTGYHLLADKRACEDDDECAVELGGCEEKCVNTPGDFYCACNNGRDFDDDGLCQPVCYNYPPGSCGIGGSCRFPDVCICTHGFESEKCLDIDECWNGEANCSDICVNRPGSFYCTCSDGFYLEDGHNCVDVDECLGGHDICSHSCINTAPGFRCECPLGYRLRLADYTCDICSIEDLECWPECTLQDSECVCPPGFALHDDGIHCIATCPCQHGGVCTSGYPDFSCNCTDTGYNGDVCEVGTLGIPREVFVHVGYEETVIHVAALSQKSLVIITKTEEELTVKPSEVYIPALSGGSNFTVGSEKMGFYTIELTLTGAGAKLFDPPPPISVLAGDVFIRLHLPHKTFPVGCFSLYLVRLSKDDSNDLTISFNSTSPWYKLDSSEWIFFTFGLPSTNANYTFPISSRGVEITTSDGHLRLGTISLRREVTNGTSVLTESQMDGCQEILLSPGDMQDFANARSSVQTMLRQLASVLPPGFELRLERNPTLSELDSFQARILTGQEVATMTDCAVAPLLPHRIYHLFQFSGSSLSLYLLNEQVVLPNTDFCILIDLINDGGKTLVMLFGKDTPLNHVGLLSAFNTHLLLNTSILGLGFSASANLNSPVAEDSPWKAMVPDANPRVWVRVQADSTPGAAVRVSSIIDMAFFQDPSKLHTHVFIEEQTFILSVQSPFVVTLDIESSGQKTSAEVTSSSHDKPVVVAVGKYGCETRGKTVVLFFQAALKDIVLQSYGLTVSGGNVVNIHLDGSYHTGALFSQTDIDDLFQTVRVFHHNLDSLLQSDTYIFDSTTFVALKGIEDTLLGIQHDALTLGVWDEQNNADIADTLLKMNLALAGLRQKLYDVEDHLYLTIQQGLQERLGFTSFFYQQLTDKLNSLSDKFHKITAKGISTINRWGSSGELSLVLSDMLLVVDGNLTYSANGNCCPGEYLCDVSGIRLELQLSGKVTERIVSPTSEWTKRIWQYIEVGKGAFMNYGQSRESQRYSAAFQDKVVLKLFDTSATTSMTIDDKVLSVEAKGQIFGLFPAAVQAEGFGLGDGNSWSLTAYVQLLPGEGSFQQALTDALNGIAQEDIHEKKERLEKATRSLRIDEQKVASLGHKLSHSALVYENSKLDVLQYEKLLNDSSDYLEILKQGMEKHQKFLSLLDAICVEQQCEDTCRESPDLKLCDKASLDGTIYYPCLNWETCALSSGSFACNMENIVCFWVQQFIIEFTDVFDSATFYQDWLKYKSAGQALSLLEAKFSNSLMVVKIREAALARDKSNYDVAAENLNSRRSEVTKLTNQIETVSVISDFSAQGIEPFMVKTCAFGEEIKGIHITAFQVMCKVNFLQTGWRWNTFRIDFSNARTSIQETAVQIYDDFLDAISSGLGNSDVRKRRSAQTTNVLLQLQQTSANNSVTNVIGIPGKDQWDKMCSEYQTYFKFLSVPVIYLLQIVDQYISEVKAANARVDQSLAYAQVSSSLSLSDGQINQASFSKYGVTQKQVEDMLAKVDPSQDKTIQQLLNTSKLLDAVNFDMIFAISSYDLIALWETQMYNFTNNGFNFSECSGYQDCVRWTFGRLNYLLSLVESTLATEAIQSTNKTAQLFYAIIDNKVNSIEAVQVLAQNISRLLSYNKTNDLLCGEIPTFPDSSHKNESLAVGQNVTLACKANGQPRPVFTWRKIGISDPLQTESENAHLNLANLDLGDEGEYYCVARNHIGSATSPSTVLEVGYTAVVDADLPSYVDLLTGDSLALSCQASGKPKPTVQWQTTAGVAITITDTNYKHDSVRTAHTGLYKCLVANVFGTDESNEAFVKVQTGVTMCPKIPLKIGFITKTSTLQSPGNTGVVIIENSLEDYFKAAMISTAQNEEGSIVIDDMKVVSKDFSIEFAVKVQSCINLQTCSRQTCEEKFRSEKSKVERAVEALQVLAGNDSLLFERDGKAYYMNSGLVEILAPVGTCASGHDQYEEFICAKSEQLVYVDPPRNLRQESVCLLWEVNEQQLHFIKGYNVVVYSGSKVILNQTTDVTWYTLGADVPEDKYTFAVRAFTNSFSSDWAETAFTLERKETSEISYIWVIGVVIAILALFLAVLYIACRVKKSHVRPSRESSATSLSTCTSMSRFGSAESWELAPSKMKIWSYDAGVSGNISLLTASESASREFIRQEEIPCISAERPQSLPQAQRDEGPSDDLTPDDITLKTSASFEMS